MVIFLNFFVTIFILFSHFILDGTITYKFLIFHRLFMFLWCISFYNVCYINKKYLFKYFLLYDSRGLFSILDNRTAILFDKYIINITYLLYFKYVNKFIEIKRFRLFLFSDGMFVFIVFLFSFLILLALFIFGPEILCSHWQ